MYGQMTPLSELLDENDATRQLRERLEGFQRKRAAEDIVAWAKEHYHEGGKSVAWYYERLFDRPLLSIDMMGEVLEDLVTKGYIEIYYNEKDEVSITACPSLIVI